jgi:Tetratricopeptide repeat
VRSADRIKTLWDNPGTGSVDGRGRRRLIAGAGLTLLVGGLLTVVGLGVVVIFLLAIACAGAVGIAVTLGLLTHRDELVTGSRRLGTYGGRFRVSAGERLSRMGPRARLFGVFVGRQARAGVGRAAVAAASGQRVGKAAFDSARATAPDLASASSEMAGRAARQIAGAGRSAAVETKRVAERIQHEARFRDGHLLQRRREALDLNAAGTRLRRDGCYDEAAELHGSALEILRELRDRHALALTLNNLALALSQTGRDAQAVGLFEEAASILRELGDEEHEGRVMANLGLTHRRQGRREESDDVLQLALTKLPPTSSAYRKIEGQLRRAS